MVQYEVRGGIDSFALYKAESTYNSDPGTWTTGAYHFGIDTSIKPTPKRELVKVRGMSSQLPALNTDKTSRDAQQIFGGKFEISVSISKGFGYISIPKGILFISSKPFGSSTCTVTSLLVFFVLSMTVNVKTYFPGTLRFLTMVLSEP